MTQCEFGDSVLSDRFWSKVTIDRSTGCWPWVASLNAAGYGQYHYEGRPRRAHRLLFVKLGGLAEGLDLDHLCRNRACVNPEHLEAVTHQVNTKRGIGGGRSRQVTHCIHGHPFDEENLRIGSNGQRKCRECMSRQQREYRARTRAALTPMRK